MLPFGILDFNKLKRVKVYSEKENLIWNVRI